MFKKFLKKTLLIFCALSITFSFLSFTTNIVKAADEEKSEILKFIPQVSIPGLFNKGENVEVSGEILKDQPDPIDKTNTKKIDKYRSTLLAKYIKGILNYGYGIGTVLAVVMVAIGGVIWLTSGGNPQKIGQAKSYIVSAVIGIILLMGSYLILSNINSDLVNLDGINVMVLTEKEYGCCQVMEGEAYAEAFPALKEECEPLGKWVENASPDPEGKKCEKNICGQFAYEMKPSSLNSLINHYSRFGSFCLYSNESVIDKTAEDFKKYLKGNMFTDWKFDLIGDPITTDQPCSEIDVCKEQTTNCLNTGWGDYCNNFIGSGKGISCYCYDQRIYLGDTGKKGDPCGGDSQGMSYCMDSCSNNLKEDSKGRQCESGLSCCRPKK